MSHQQGREHSQHAAGQAIGIDKAGERQGVALKEAKPPKGAEAV